jgi:hypothetical protein
MLGIFWAIFENYKGPFSTPGVSFAPRVNLASRGVKCPLGRMFTPLRSSSGVFRRMEGQTKNYIPRGYVHP